METPVKKMKRLAAPTTDPFEVIPIPLIHDLILQHFTGNEVKKLFQVNKEWNKIVSNSNASMKTLQLKIEMETLPEKVEGLMKSQRRYSSMKALFENNTEIERQIMLLETFSQSLVELEISVHSEYLVVSAPRQLQFLKLKKLTLNVDVTQLLHSMETNSLTTLKIYYFAEIYQAEHIYNFLKKQHHLQRLELCVSSMFFEQIKFTNVPFALKELSLHLFDEMSPAASLHLHSSLRNMSDSLETFETYDASAELVQIVVNELPKLKLFRCNNCKPDMPNLKRNTSISELRIQYIPTSILESLILALENLRSFSVGYYHSMQNLKEDFKWIVKNASRLECLRCSRSQVDEIRAFYQLLKTQDDSINQNINIEAIP